MSYGNPQLCRNGCGAWIYFDKDSAAGHPSADKWLPLEYNHGTGIKTGLIHQCSNKKSDQLLGKKPNSTTSSTQETQQEALLARVTEESVQEGITAFSMMTDLIRLVEQTQKLLVTLNEKVEHLTKLVYALSQQKQQHDHHDQNPHTLLDNR